MGRLLMTAANYVAGSGSTPVINMCTGLRSMVAILVQCIYNSRWHSILCNKRYALGSNVAMVATGLWWVACTTYVVLSKSNCWPRILRQVMLVCFLVFQSGRGFP